MSDADLRQQQNDQISAQMGEWQLAWHELFDKDPGQATADNAAKGECIPDELDFDYRIIHGFCEVTSDTRAACFALLPRGADLSERFEQFFVSRNASISEAAAKALALKLCGLLQKLPINFQSDWSNLVIANRGDDALEALVLDYTVYDLFQGSMIKPHDKDKLSEIAADLFLTEPLFAAAGNWYQPGQWITSVYLEPEKDACLAIIYELWLGDWDFLIGSKGVALINESEA